VTFTFLGSLISHCSYHHFLLEYRFISTCIPAIVPGRSVLPVHSIQVVPFVLFYLQLFIHIVDALRFTAICSFLPLFWASTVISVVPVPCSLLFWSLEVLCSTTSPVSTVLSGVVHFCSGSGILPFPGPPPTAFLFGLGPPGPFYLPGSLTYLPPFDSTVIPSTTCSTFSTVLPFLFCSLFYILLRPF